MGRRFVQVLVRRIAAERGIPTSSVRVVAVETFPRNRWGHVGQITVGYEPGSSALASYGYTAEGAVVIYAD